MKKLFLFAVSALMMLGSCTQDEMVNAPLMGEDGKTIIVASIEGQPSTRMTVNQNGSLSWEASDEFLVFGATNNVTFTTTEQNAASGLFTGDGGIPEDDSYAAYYPFDNALSISGSTLTVTLKSSYTSANTFKAPMWGKYNNGSVSFKHLCAALEVSYKDIPQDYTTLLVEASSPIAGPFSVSLAPIPSDDANNDPMAPADQPTTSDGNPVIATLSTHNGNNPCEVRVTITPGEEGVFYIPLPVGFYQSLKVSAVKGDGNSIASEEKIVLKEWSELEIERKGLYYTTATYVQVGANTPAEVSNQIGNLQPNSVVDLTETIDATADNAGSLALPNADATYNFANTPTTTSEKPLTFTEVEGSDGAKVNINMPANEGDTGIYAVINTPNSTVALEGGTYESLTATTAENTLIIGEGVTIMELIVKGGNVRIEGGTVTKVENEESKTITYVVKEANDFNAIPEGVTEVELGDDITVSDILVLDRSITLNGAGYTLTSSLVNNSARVINVNCTDSVVIKNLTIATTATKNSQYDVRAINVIQKAAKLTLDNVNASGFKRTINVAASSEGSSITINGGSYSGYSAMNITGNSTTITATNTEFYGVNDAGLGSTNDYAVIAIGDKTTSDVTSNVKVTINGGKLVASSDNGNPQTIVQVSDADQTNVSVNANLTLYDENVLCLNEESNTSVKFKSEYKDELEAQGYVVSEETDDMVTVTGVAEAKIGDTLYSTLANAITAVQANETIKLLRDITLMESLTIPTGKDFTFDLNEKTITINAAEGATTVTDFANNGTLTITNGKIVAENKLKTRRCIYNYGTMTIDGVEFTQTYGTTQKGAAINNEGKMTIADATVNSVYYSIWNSGAGAELTVKKGTFTCDNIDGMYGYCVMNQLGATLVVDDGEFTGDHGAICINGGKATLNKGTFTCTGVANQTDHVIYVESGATLEYVEADCTFDNSADKKLDNSNAEVIYEASGSIITKK